MYHRQRQVQKLPPKQPTIHGFRGQYDFLSNFYPSPIEVDGILYPTVEHAYQAAKAKSYTIKRTIAGLSTPGKAKRYGQKITPLPKRWYFFKVNIMSQLLSKKFETEPLKSMLLATDPFILEETNFWGDTYWGVCNNVGSNMLGLILMNVRTQLRTPPIRGLSFALAYGDENVPF